jgi:uncharacterized protein (TIGR03437 family)
MKKTMFLSCAGLLLACASGAMADTAQTIPFLTQLLPANETPPISDTSTGSVIVWVHVIRDSGGNITSGSVDFDVSTKFSSAVTVTGLHIHNAPAGTAGQIVVPTDVNSTTNSIAVDATGKVRIQKQVQVPAPATVATIVDMLANPQNYYVNIHTTDHAGGAMRGQIVPAEMKIVMGLMSPQNEVPPTTSNGSAIATVTVLRSKDAGGNVVFAEAIFNALYTGLDATSSGTMFTGFHIHKQVVGVNGPVILNTGIGGGANAVAIDPSGSGTLNYLVAVAASDGAAFSAEVDAINGLFDNPGGFYINAHTDKFGGGVVRDQLRNTDSGTFQVSMLPSNETPPIAGLAATGTAAVSIYTLRNADGTAAAGTAIFDVNFRGFPAPTTFTGLHIHDGPAGVAGGVTINTGLGGANTIVSDTGNGNAYKFVTVATTAGIATLNSIVKDASQQYVNLHTTVNPGGAIRSQLALPLAVPAVLGVAANASPITHAAPGSILSIYGTNLSQFTSGLQAFRGLTALPTSMNGVSVTIAGFKAPFYFVSPLQLNVQVPFEVPPTGAVGSPVSQPLVVTTAGGVSVTLNIVVDPLAPSLFIVDAASNLGAVVKNSDFSLTTTANPAKVGDPVVIYSTGLGQVTPAAFTGVLLAPPSTGFNNTAAVTVTIGSQPATVIYSIGSPGFVGLYQTAVTVPSGVTGTVPVVMKAGTATSNSVNMVVQ